MFTLRDVWRNANPTGAVGDFVTVFKEAGRNRWRIAALSAATTLGLFWSLTHDSWKKPRALPEITYITTFAPDRSETESLAFREARQKERDELLARQAEADEATRRLYKVLGRATGIDVDTLDAQAKADRAAAEAADKARTEAILKQGQAPVAKQ